VLAPGKGDGAMSDDYDFREAVFEPETLQIMATAYEDSVRFLHVADSTDPLTEVIAKEVIETARLGIREPTEIRRRVLSALGKAE
jgi:hypothetical protein